MNRYRVVVCSRCSHHWIVDGHSEARERECPRCGRRRDRRRLRVLETAADREAAADLRAEILADRAHAVGGANSFDLEGADTFAALAERVDEKPDPADGFAEAGEAAAAGLEADKERWREEQLEITRANDAVWREQVNQIARADAIAFRQDRAEDLLAAEPDWPVDEGQFTALFAGQDAPLGDVNLQVGPRVSEFAEDLLDQLLDHLARAVRDRVHDAVGADADARSPSLWKGWLMQEVGVTALEGDYAASLARFALEDGEDSQAALREELTSVGTPGGHATGSTDAIVDGPLAALTLAERRPEVVVRFDAPAWADARHDTAQRALDVLRKLARVADVCLVITSTRLADLLADRFEIGDVDVTETLDAARTGEGPDDETPSMSDRAREALQQIDPWKNGYGRILLNLDDDHERYQKSLSDDLDVDLGMSAVSQYLPVLEAAGLLVKDRSGRRNTVRLTSLGDVARTHVDPSDGTLLPPDQATLGVDFIATPHAGVGAVCGAQQGRGEGTGDRRRSVEGWLRSAAEVDGPHDYVQWLWGPSARRDKYVAHKRYTAAAHGTLSCVDHRSIVEFDDPRVAFLSAIEDEVLVLVQYGGPMATLARIANALLSSKAFSKLLSEEAMGDAFQELEDGAGQKLVEEFDASLQKILTKGQQIGWFSEDEHQWDSFRDRISGVRALCLKKLGELHDSDDFDARGELIDDLHGLIASATQLYRATGLDLVINVRCPDTANIIKDDRRRRDFLDFFKFTIPKNAAYRSETGVHSHYRQTHEQRIEKRKSRLPPDVTEGAASEPTAQWVLTGRAATDLREDLEDAIEEEIADQVEEGVEAAPYFDVEVTNGNAYSAMKAVVREFASLKNKSVADASAAQQLRYATDVDRLTRLAIAATGAGDRPTQGNPMALAEGMVLLERASSGQNWLTVGDLEYAFSCMSPEEFLPGVAPSTSAFVQAMLDSDDTMTRSEVLEETGYSTSSWERSLANDIPGLAALGIVQESSEGGTPARTATLEPWWTSSTDCSEPRLSDERTAVDPGATETDVVFELACALGVDLPYEVLAMPPDLATAYRDPELEGWRAWIWAAVASGDEYETGPPDTPSTRASATVRLGIAPSTVVLDESQTTIASDASVVGGAGPAVSKPQDGTGEGAQ